MVWGKLAREKQSAKTLGWEGVLGRGQFQRHETKFRSTK